MDCVEESKQVINDGVCDDKGARNAHADDDAHPSSGDVGVAEPANGVVAEEDSRDEDGKERKGHRKREKKESRRYDESRERDKDRDRKRHKRKHHSRDRSEERSRERSREKRREKGSQERRNGDDSNDKNNDKKEGDIVVEGEERLSGDKPRSASRSKEEGSDRRGKDKERRSGKDRSRERSSRRDRDRDRERDRERDRDRDRERDRDRDRDREKRRSSSGGRRRRHSSSSSRERRRRDRSRERDRSYRRRRSPSDSRERRRERDRDRDKDRDRERARERDRDKDRDRERIRERDRERNKDTDRDKNGSGASSAKTDKGGDDDRPKVTLKDIIAQNPGISVTEALQQLHAINAANSMGLAAPTVGAGGLVGAPMANPMALAQATKLLREVYVGNIPPGITITQLTDFVNNWMKQMNLCMASPFGPPVITCWISTDGHYAFVEFRTVEEATAALNNLGGVMIGAHQLKVGRPKSNGPTSSGIGGIPGLPLGLGTLVATPSIYGAQSMIPGLGAAGLPTAPVVSSTAAAPASTDCIMVSNLPLSIGEAEVRELLEPFGEIQAFNFIKVNAGSSSGGAAVLEYVDKTLTDEAVKGLNGLQLGGSKLSVQRVPAQMAAMLLVPPTPSSSGAGGTGVGSVVSAGSAASSPDPLLTHPPTCVLRLSNMTTMEDLQDDDAYDELQEDVGDECNNYGTVKAIVIPRPLEGSPAKQNEMRGVGMIFVSFTSPEGATRAKAAVHGRTFNGQKVVAVFYPEDLFEKKEYSLPDGYGEDNTVDDDDLN